MSRQGIFAQIEVLIDLWPEPFFSHISVTQTSQHHGRYESTLDQKSFSAEALQVQGKMMQTRTFEIPKLQAYSDHLGAFVLMVPKHGSLLQLLARKSLTSTLFICDEIDLKIGSKSCATTIISQLVPNLTSETILTAALKLTITFRVAQICDPSELHLGKIMRTRATRAVLLLMMKLMNLSCSRLKTVLIWLQLTNSVL